MRKRLFSACAVAVAVFTLSMSAAYADASPPTNGGNGAGQSGQCTGNPDDRPPGLDCAH
ncbi:MAG TPA: hypothetical protein VIY48_02795 [Candidatus Paceibacterota bacterium]